MATSEGIPSSIDIELLELNDNPYIIREGVKVIGDRAFFSCEYLKDVNIPNSVTSIGDASFMVCI